MNRRKHDSGSLRPGPVQALTLIELLCVMVIISILVSLLLPTVSRAYLKARSMSEEFEAPEIADLVVLSSRNYCAQVPQYRFESKSDFATKCGLPPKGRDWVVAKTTEFAPFGCLDATNKVVLVFHYGRNDAKTYYFSKGLLTVTPE